MSSHIQSSRSPRTADTPTSPQAHGHEVESAARENLWGRLLPAIALCVFLALAAEYAAAQSNQDTFDAVAHNIKTVFVIVMENHNWTGDPGTKGTPSYNIKGNVLAPYINHTLLPQASYASNYRNVYGIHPSLPNYLWMEAGTNFHILDDAPGAVHHQSTHQHLAAYLDKAGIPWKLYDEASVGNVCPLKRWHNPFVFFDDMTDNQNRSHLSALRMTVLSLS